MSNPFHHNPFKALLHARPNVDVEAYLRGFGPNVIWTDRDGSRPDVRLDLSEDDHAYHVRADLPGVDKQDIDLRIDGNTIRIEAETRREPPETPCEKGLCSERRHGHISRTFSLPSSVDESKATAHYENGVLALTLPKKMEETPHRIAID